MNISYLFHKKISPSLYISAAFFLICLCLDIGTTNYFAKGDFTQEANVVARIWWQITGSLRFVEIPIWYFAVCCAAYLIYQKSTFLSLLWLNMLSFGHILGFITWLPYKTLDFVYLSVKSEWMVGYSLTLIALAISLPITILQMVFERRAARTIRRSHA